MNKTYTNEELEEIIKLAPKGKYFNKQEFGSKPWFEQANAYIKQKRTGGAPADQGIYLMEGQHKHIAFQLFVGKYPGGNIPAGEKLPSADTMPRDPKYKEQDWAQIRQEFANLMKANRRSKYDDDTSIRGYQPPAMPVAPMKPTQPMQPQTSFTVIEHLDEGVLIYVNYPISNPPEYGMIQNYFVQFQRVWASFTDQQIQSRMYKIPASQLVVSEASQSRANIGEFIYWFVDKWCHSNGMGDYESGKITGMILDLPKVDIEELLGSYDRLLERAAEAHKLIVSQ